MRSGILATIVGLVGFVTFTALLVKNVFGVAAYITLLTLLAFVSIVIPVLQRLKELDLKNLKMTLDKIESVRKEIYAKETDLRRTSLLLAELIAANAAVTGIWGDGDSKKYSDALVRSKIKHLAKQLQFTDDELASIFKYENALASVKGTPEEVKENWEAFVGLLKHESEKDS